ncbi:c-type cytochrome [Ferrovibrio terrae]|jgi:mono/diheme cytochrome c family protein|uniref:c-type cytochrome n=1 Tax=Ferrovibrio terrae TaxID=2594003 RepID=UPI0031380E4D
MTSRCRLLLAVMLLAPALCLATTAARAAEVGNATMGRSLTERWCVACHGTTSRGSDAAPSLPRLMRGRSADEARLRGWLAAPHPPMRGIELSRQETEDIIAWLRQLARE